MDEIWQDDFTFMQREVPDGVFTLTMHPQVIGRGHRMLMLERLIHWFKEHPGTRFPGSGRGGGVSDAQPRLQSCRRGGYGDDPFGATIAPPGTPTITPSCAPLPRGSREEMVASQPALVAPILANPQAADMAQVILDVDESGEPIVVTGCGTSEHGAIAVAELLDAALRQRGARGGRVEARQAFEATLDPRAGGLCLAVSESGGTRATLLALEAARDVGATTATITANPQGQAASTVGLVMLTPAATSPGATPSPIPRPSSRAPRSPPRSPRSISTPARSPHG